MKHSFILTLVGILFCANAFSQTTAEESIKKVCISETEAFINMDYATWASYHVQGENDQLAWNNPDGTFGSQSGWETIGSGMKTWFETAKKEYDKRTHDNFTFVIQGNMAFVAYHSNSLNAEGKTTRIQEYRTLLNQNGDWKILAVQAFVDYPSGK